METWYFVSDVDDGKRAKVIDWMTADETALRFIAKKIGVAPDRIKVVRARLSADGQFVEVKVEETAERAGAPVKIAFSADGNKLAVESAWIQVFDADAAVDRLIVKNWVSKAPPKGAADVTTIWEKLAGEQPGKSETERFHIVVLEDAADTAPVINDVFILLDNSAAGDTDAEFLKRVLTDARGSGPTALELKYFTEDKDPKKREKLLDALLKDPAVQKKLGDAWKAKMLELKPVTVKINEANHDIIRAIPKVRVVDSTPPIVVKPLPPQPPQPPMVVKPFVVPAPPVPPAPPAVPQADKWEKLVGELIAAKKSDEAILEALTLATLGRLPTDSEKKLTTAGVSTAADRKTAWVAVARALAGTDKPTTTKFKVVAPVPPVPPAPPVPPVPPVKP
jgi:hypothetical protein